MFTRDRNSATFVALVLLLLTSSSCGGDDDSPSNGTTTGGTGGSETSAGTGGSGGQGEGGQGQGGQGGSGTGSEYTDLDISVCDPDADGFTVDIDNEYFPLAVGTELVLEGVEEDDEGEMVDIRVEITVLDETEDVAGVTTRVVESQEFEDDELIEVARDFYVQAEDGTVCYYGEDVDDYEGGDVVGHEGAWRAGEDDAAPGIIMPGDPMPGTQFAQEDAPGVAEDMSAIAALGESISVPAGDFDDALHALDWNPLEGESMDDAEDKYYAPGIGLVVDDIAELTSFDIP